MLMAHPVVLHDLVEQYETLRVLDAEDGEETVRQRLADVSYALCVATGTKDVDAAIIAARHQLPGARPQDDSLRSDGSETAADSDSVAEPADAADPTGASGNDESAGAPVPAPTTSPTVTAEQRPNGTRQQKD